MGPREYTRIAATPRKENPKELRGLAAFRERGWGLRAMQAPYRVPKTTVCLSNPFKHQFPPSPVVPRDVGSVHGSCSPARHRLHLPLYRRDARTQTSL